MADLTLKQLKNDVAQMAKDATRGAEAIRARAQQIDEEAKDTSRVAEMIAGMGVDTATVGEAKDLAKITTGLSSSVIAYAAAGDTTAKAALTAHQQAGTSHDGIQEAVSRSSVDTKNLDRGWLRQE